MSMLPSTGFIGGGNMATAIGKGILNNGLCKPSDMWVSGPHLEKLTHWKDLGVNVTVDNGKIIKECEIIFLAVKPHLLDEAIRGCMLTKPFNERRLVISVLAGTSISVLKEKLSMIPQARIVRMMPNTPMMVGFGATVYCPSVEAEQDCNIVEKILMSCGIYQRVPENMINAAGGLSGSGPAFVYLMIEALSDGGVKQGLPREMATKFAAQTVLGAAKMVLDTGKHPGELKDEVCSPGGSTICGIHELEKGCVRASYIRAIEAAVERTTLMGQLNK